MCTPKTFIGCYPVVKCEQYGFVSDIELGKKVTISKDDGDIIVKDDSIIIGELKIPESDKIAFNPFLSAGNKPSNLYECKITYVANNSDQNSRYRVSIWAKVKNVNGK